MATHLKTAAKVADLAVLRGRAKRYSCRGLYREAAECLLEALKRLKPQRFSPSPDHLIVWNEIGMVCKYLGKFQMAENYYRLALRHARRVFHGSFRDLFLASLYHNLGGLDHSRRHYLRGERYARRGLQLRLKSTGVLSLGAASDMVALAALLDGQRKFAESETLYMRALPVYRREYRRSHPELAVLLNNLASLYHATNRPTRAEPLFRATLRMNRRELGALHPDVGVTLNNFGMFYCSQEKSRQAGRCFQQALRILEERVGSTHPNTRAVRANYRRLNDKKHISDR